MFDDSKVTVTTWWGMGKGQRLFGACRHVVPLRAALPPGN
jgi:hypothetical protein